MYRIKQHARRYPILLGLVLVLALVASACTFQVQPIEKYSSQDGYLSLSYPVAWEILEESASDGTTTVFLGSQADLRDMDVIPSGEAGVAIMLMPNFIPDTGLDTLTLNPEDLASLIQAGAVEGQAGDVSDIETIVLANGTEAYKFTASSPESDITAYSFAPADEMLAIGMFISAPGETNEVRTKEIENILNSVRFHGDAAEFAARAREILAGGN